MKVLKDCEASCWPEISLAVTEICRVIAMPFKVVAVPNWIMSLACFCLSVVKQPVSHFLIDCVLHFAYFK